SANAKQTTTTIQEEKVNTISTSKTNSTISQPNNISAAELKKQIVQLMAKENQIEQNCVQKNPTDAVNFESTTLSNIGQQFIVSGHMCGYGARTPMFWVYEYKNGKIMMLGNFGATDVIEVATQKTNGYNDILIS